jgi:hypothetical protein
MTRLTTPLHELQNACVLNSIATLFKNLPPAQIEFVLRKHGYGQVKRKKVRGTPFQASVLALEELGAKIGRVVTFHGWLPEHLVGKAVRHNAAFMSLGQFCKQFKTGAWYVRIKGHALTVIGGKIVDVYYGAHRRRQKIVDAFEILNADPLVPVDTCRPARKPGKQSVKLLVNGNPFRKGTVPWKRFSTMLALLPTVTDPARIMKDAGIPSGAFTRWQKKGYIVLEERYKAPPEEQKMDALSAVIRIIAETVQETGEQGAPAGVIYAAMMTAIPNLGAENFNALVAVAVTKGWIKYGPAHLLLPGAVKVLP